MALRIAVAGAGGIGRVHIGAIRRSRTVGLASIVDPSPAAAAVAAEAGVTRHVSLAAMIEHDRPDAVVLATPNVLHVGQALQCLAAGLPMLLEKPIAATVADAERLVRAAGRSSVPILVGHHRAHSPIMIRSREIIESGVLGRLVSVMGSAAFFKPDRYFDEAPWRREPGAGPILLNMIHEVHNLRMLCGEIRSVQAFGSNDVRGFPVEDTVAINLRFANGALGSFMLSDTAACSRSWEQTSGENPAYATDADDDCYLIAGTDGSLAIPTMRLKTYRSPAKRSWWAPFEIGRIALQRADPIERQMEHFGEVVRGVAQPRVGVRDGLQNLRVTEAIAKAARQGCTVEIPVG